MAVIEFNNVSKSFPRHSERLLLRSRVRRLFFPSERERFYALSGVSFRVEEGDSLAVVGSNGAGKSTLLGVVAGLAVPDEGQVVVKGQVAALLELGSGFHPDLTGAENAYMNAALLGLSRAKTREVFDSIVDFSEIRDFIKEPLRTYSNGMVMRLAFSVAVNVDPDILVVDEVLAVGDQAFQEKCFKKIRELKRRRRTFLCVSHASAMVRELCTSAIWLERGKLMMEGSVDEVLAAYSAFRAPSSETHLHQR